MPEVWISGGGTPSHYVDVTDTFPQKIAALKSHVSQVGQRDGFEGFLRGSAGPDGGAGRPARGPPGRGVPGHRRRLTRQQRHASQQPGRCDCGRFARYLRNDRRDPARPPRPRRRYRTDDQPGAGAAGLTGLGWPQAQPPVSKEFVHDANHRHGRRHQVRRHRGTTNAAGPLPQGSGRQDRYAHRMRHLQLRCLHRTVWTACRSRAARCSPSRPTAPTSPRSRGSRTASGIRCSVPSTRSTPCSAATARRG